MYSWPLQIRNASPRPVPGARTAIGALGSALPALIWTVSAGCRCGTAWAMARRSFNRVTLRRPRPSARAASFRSHGRLVRCARPSITGPATSKQAVVASAPVLARNASTIGCRPGKSALGNSCSATNARGPASGETSASRVVVPPISPAISIMVPPSRTAGFAAGAVCWPPAHGRGSVPGRQRKTARTGPGVDDIRITPGGGR